MYVAFTYYFTTRSLSPGNDFILPIIPLPSQLVITLGLQHPHNPLHRLLCRDQSVVVYHIRLNPPGMHQCSIDIFIGQIYTQRLCNDVEGNLRRPIRISAPALIVVDGTDFGSDVDNERRGGITPAPQKIVLAQLLDDEQWPNGVGFVDINHSVGGDRI